MRVTLDAIEAKLRALLGDERVLFRRITAGKVEFLTLDLVSEGEPHRYLRIGVADIGDGYSVFSMRWSSGGSSNEVEDGEGSTWGDTEFTLRLVKHWFVDHLPWREVPELNRELGAKG